MTVLGVKGYEPWGQGHEPGSRSNISIARMGYTLKTPLSLLKVQIKFYVIIKYVFVFIELILNTVKKFKR